MMKTSLNTDKLIAWLLHVASEFECIRIKISHARNAWQVFDEYCKVKVNERIEFTFWQEKAKKHLQLFLSGRPSCFDQLLATPEKEF